MMSKQKEWMIGLEFGPEYAQLSYFHPSMKEPQTAGDHEADYLIPVPEQVWQEASDPNVPVSILPLFLEGCLDRIPGKPDPADLRIMVTVPSLEGIAWERAAKALETLGTERKHIFVQDYQSSFYYYAVNQKRELWNGDVALIEYTGGTMIGWIMHIDRTKSPVVVSVKQAAAMPVDEDLRGGRDDESWDMERDRLFFELLKRVFERRNVVTCYLLGTYFDRRWAVRSFQYLCFRRHAFQGGNLYTKGACYGAMERMGALRMPETVYLGSAVVRDNLGMKVKVRGKEVYYPLISAGENWYEAYHACEIIPDEDRRLIILSRSMTGGPEVGHILRLTDVPARSPRASRLKMSLYFTSPECAVVELEDLGFGGFYRSSGQVWKRSIYLPTGDDGEAEEDEL